MGGWGAEGERVDGVCLRVRTRGQMNPGSLRCKGPTFWTSILRIVPFGMEGAFFCFLFF